MFIETTRRIQDLHGETGITFSCDSFSKLSGMKLIFFVWVLENMKTCFLYTDVWVLENMKPLFCILVCHGLRVDTAEVLLEE